MRRTTVVIRYVPAGSRNNAHPTTVEKPCASACPVRACHGMRGMLCVVDMWLLYQHDLSRARLGPTHSYWSASHRKTARVNCIRRAKAARSQTFTRTSPQEMHAPSHTRTPKRTSAGRWAIDHCCALKMALSETQEQQRFRYDEGRLNTRKRARNCMQRTLIDTARASRMRAVSRRAMPSPGFQARQHSYWRPQFRWSAYHKVSQWRHVYSDCREIRAAKPLSPSPTWRGCMLYARFNRSHVSCFVCIPNKTCAVHAPIIGCNPKACNSVIAARLRPP
jgi:hypothetical protein